MTAKKAARKAAPKKAAAKGGGVADADGRPAVEVWLRHVKPEQQAVARRLDKIILAGLPGAVSAIKFRKPSNPLGVPFYGLAGQGWIVSVNSLKSQVRVILFAGNSLKPMPPFAAPPRARGVDFSSEDEIDEKKFKTWLDQAKKLPGWGKV